MRVNNRLSSTDGFLLPIFTQGTVVKPPGAGYNEIYFLWTEGGDGVKQIQVHSRPLRFVCRVVQTYLNHNVPRAAAQMSYYLLFSLFPVLMIIVSILGLLHLDVASAMQVVENLPIHQDVLEEYVTYVVTNESPALLWGGILMALTASSAAFRGLMRVSGEICGQPAYRKWVMYPVSFAMSAVLLLTIFAFLVATVTGQWFLSWITTRFHFTAVIWAWRWLRFPIMFALGVLALSALYRVSLSKKALPRGRAWPGAVFASVALVIGTAVFSIFISMSSRYSLVYGSLASIIILMLWFFVCANILVLGNVVNYALTVERDGEGRPFTFYFG